jgi:hypothetical protein
LGVSIVGGKTVRLVVPLDQARPGQRPNIGPPSLSKDIRRFIDMQVLLPVAEEGKVARHWRR